jgi:hypothetical protein
MTTPAYRCDICDDPTTNPEDDYSEFVCDNCLQNRAEAAWERHCEDCGAPTLLEQQIAAMKFK